MALAASALLLVEEVAEHLAHRRVGRDVRHLRHLRFFGFLGRGDVHHAGRTLSISGAKPSSLNCDGATGAVVIGVPLRWSN